MVMVSVIIFGFYFWVFFIFWVAVIDLLLLLYLVAEERPESKKKKREEYWVFEFPLYVFVCCAVFSVITVFCIWLSTWVYYSLGVECFNGCVIG
jgi:hypothetical protein